MIKYTYWYMFCIIQLIHDRVYILIYVLYHITNTWASTHTDVRSVSYNIFLFWRLKSGSAERGMVGVELTSNLIYCMKLNLTLSYWIPELLLLNSYDPFLMPNKIKSILVLIILSLADCLISFNWIYNNSETKRLKKLWFFNKILKLNIV